jgi:hypothetical protein
MAREMRDRRLKGGGITYAFAFLGAAAKVAGLF